MTSISRATGRAARRSSGLLLLVALVVSACSTSQVVTGAGQAAGSRPSAGQIPTTELVGLLTRTGVGPRQEEIELTYASPLFFEATGLQPPAEMGARPTLAFMLAEAVHEGTLPAAPPAVFLATRSGARVAPYDVRVTADDPPHHRTVRLLFPDPDGLSTASRDGQSHTLTLVVPAADGTVSGANTFIWQVPIDGSAAIGSAPAATPGGSQ